MAEPIGFIAAGSLLVVLSVLALLALGIGSLESRMGISRDGISVHKRAPAWEATDVSGTKRRSPHGSAWQVLVFADQELAFFHDLALGLNKISLSEPDVEVVILSPRSSEICRVIAEGLDLSVPIVPDAGKLYKRFRVRVRPFVHVVDPQGNVRAKGVANYEATVRAFLRWGRSPKDALSHQAIGSPA
ncbi:MAG: peroxiredoxin family protein [Candidatus Dormibacteraceae bacterium]